MHQIRYGLRKVVKRPYQEALEKTRDALACHGFGVLTEIDMQAKLKEKLGADIQRYVILGACSPPLAKRALDLEPDIGLLLPCNVIVYEHGPDESVVAILDPNGMVEMTGNEKLESVASEARTRLEKVMELV